MHKLGEFIESDKEHIHITGGISAERLKEAGWTEHDIAVRMNQMRRDLGVEYKDMTPEPLREFIYEKNIDRCGDPLGPTYDFLKIKKGKSDAQIIESSSRPNRDIDEFLSDFEGWLWKHKK